MAEYTHRPEPSYGIELRDGWTEDDYVAQARGFRSTAEFREYYCDANPERKAAMRRERESQDRESDEDLGRYAECLRVCND